MKSYGVTIQMKPLQQYFHMVPFIYYVVLALESGNKILLIYQLNETSPVVARVDYLILLEMPSFLFYYRSKWTQSTQSINLNFSPFSTPLLGAFWFYELLKIKHETFTQRCLPGNLGSKSKLFFDKTYVHFGRGRGGAGRSVIQTLR